MLNMESFFYKDNPLQKKKKNTSFQSKLFKQMSPYLLQREQKIRNMKIKYFFIHI